MKIVVSVPGKIILSGEHAVVYGKPAIAAAVDRRLTVTLRKRSDGKKIIHTDADDTKLVAAAVEVIRKELRLRKNTVGRHAFFADGYELDIKSDIPIGAGMGSSAAVIAGTIAAFLVGVTGTNKLDPKLVSELTIKAERINYPNESGLDPTTVSFGGLIWYRKELEFLKTFWKLQFKIADKLNNFYVVDTGRPKETTGEMVSLVGEKLKPKSEKVKPEIQDTLNEIEKQTKQLILGLREENERMIIYAIKRNEKLLEELGVVGEFARNVVKEVEKSGGAAKISGAGGAKDRSGIILVYHKDKQKVAKIAKKHKLDWFPAKLGAKGVRVKSMTV